MRKNKLNQLIEYLSATLILSYFFLHNIFLVLIGTSFSLYLVNIDVINSLINAIKKNSFLQKFYKKSNKNSISIYSNHIKPKSNKKVNELELVEAIEELGFIPSINRECDSNEA